MSTLHSDFESFLEEMRAKFRARDEAKRAAYAAWLAQQPKPAEPTLEQLREQRAAIVIDATYQLSEDYSLYCREAAKAARAADLDRRIAAMERGRAHGA